MTTTATVVWCKSPAAGMGRLSWLCEDGEQVSEGQPVARFNVGNVAHNVAAPATGRLTIIAKVAESVTMQGGNPIGKVDTGTTGNAPKRATMPLESPAPSTRPNTKPAPVPTQPASVVPPAAAIVEQPAPRRRGTITPPIEVVEIVEPQATIEPKGKGKSKRAVNRTYSVGSHQEQAIAKLAKTLSLAALDDESIPTGVNESELVRAGIELLLGLPRPALLDVLKGNRDREKRGKWGRGRPRPLK